MQKKQTAKFRRFQVLREQSRGSGDAGILHLSEELMPRDSAHNSRPSAAATLHNHLACLHQGFQATSQSSIIPSVIVCLPLVLHQLIFACKRHSEYASAQNTTADTPVLFELKHNTAGPAQSHLALDDVPWVPHAYVHFPSPPRATSEPNNTTPYNKPLPRRLVGTHVIRCLLHSHLGTPVTSTSSTGLVDALWTQLAQAVAHQGAAQARIAGGWCRLAAQVISSTPHASRVVDSGARGAIAWSRGERFGVCVWCGLVKKQVAGKGQIESAASSDGDQHGEG